MTRQFGVGWFLVRRLVLLMVLVILTGFVPKVQAQFDAVYFPQTGHYLQGAFREYWERNGGVEIFGYPISQEYISPVNGQMTQYFERARFQLNSQAGLVELGNLGVEATVGRIFPKAAPIQNTPDRIYIPETQHIIQYGFKTIWETKGGILIFGLPISEEIDELLDNGEWHTVQYFERSRFEYWPEFPPGQRVLISMLGRVLAPRDVPPQLLAPLPPGAPPPAPAAPGSPEAPDVQPSPGPAPLPANVNANVSPSIGAPGTTFVFTASGFDDEEDISVWVNRPDGTVLDLDRTVSTNSDGELTTEQDITVTADSTFQSGVWNFVAQALSSERQAIGYFRVVNDGTVPAPTPTPERTTECTYIDAQGTCYIVGPNDADRNCDDFESNQRPITVVDSNNDPWELDRDNDGIGCEV